MTDIKHKSIYQDFPELKTFLSNMDPSAKYDNVYIIRTEDMDGNIVDTKFGLNLIPDVYFDSLSYMETGRYQLEQWYLYLFADPNPQASSYTDTGIIYTEGSKSINTLVDFSYQRYDAEFDSVSGIISGNMKIGTFVFDYNYTGIEDDIVITKAMLCKDERVLTEVTIYDASGEFSSFTKHPNERVTITVICTGYIHEDVITGAWTNGVYAVLNPAYIAAPVYGGNAADFAQWGSRNIHYTGGYLGQYRYKDTYINNIKNWNFVSTMNSNVGIRNGANNKSIDELSQMAHNSWLITDPRIFVSKSVFRSKYQFSDNADRNLNDSFWLFTEEKLPSPETLVIDPVYTDTSFTTTFGNSFGKMFNTNTWEGFIPCTDFSMTNVKAWNHATQAWDIDISFTNEDGAYYDNPFVNDSLNKFYINSLEAYVRMNPKASTKPLLSLSFSDRSPAPLYAADKYWDTSTWTRIYDPSSIPAALQNKRYYITTGKSNEVWTPTFDQNVHRLTSPSSSALTGLPSTNEFRKTWAGFRPVGTFDSSNTWFLAQEHVYVPASDSSWGTPTYYQIDGPETRNGNTTPPCSNVLRFAFEDKLMVGSAVDSPETQFPTAIRVYDIGSRTSSAIPYTDIQLDIGTTTGLVGMYSSSKNGYFVISNTSDNIANIIDVDNATMTKLTNARYCYAIEDTNYCVYQKMDAINTRTFVVYDMSTNTEHAQFVLPERHENMNMIFGLRDHVYIRTAYDSEVYVDMYDISDGTLTGCQADTFTTFVFRPDTLPTNINENGVRLNICSGVLYADDIIVLYDARSLWNWDNYAHSMLIKYSDPLVARQIFLDGTDQTYWRKNHDGNDLVESFTGIKLGLFTTCIADPNNTSLQKRVFMLNALSPNESSSGYISPYNYLNTPANKTTVYDIGYIADNCATSSREAVPEHFPTVSGTAYFGVVYWNDGVIVFNNDGTGATWYPIENFLPHQVTGSTYTIQAWNNPMAVYDKNIIMYKTNRGDINTNIAPTLWAGMVWGHGSYNSNSEFVTTGAKSITGMITPPHQNDYVTLHTGDVVRCEAKLETEYDVSPTSGTIQFCVDYFYDNATKLSFKKKGNTAYVAADGAATITISEDMPVATFNVRTTLADTAWTNGGRVCISASMFEYIKVWVNGSLLPV